MAASTDDLLTADKLRNQQLAAIVAALQGIFPRVSSIAFGVFQLGAAVTTTVSQTTTQANSVIVPFPTNAAAGTLQGSTRALYVSARTANASFAVSTASGVAAAGTETFLYVIITP